MKEKGYVSVHRSIFNSFLWKGVFSKGQAWVDLLLLATHEKTSFEKRGVLVELERGEVGVSILGLSARWRWSRTKTESFLNRLKTEHQITYTKNSVTTVICILNYDKYQTQKSNRKASEKHQKSTFNNVNNVNKEKKKNIKKENGRFLPKNHKPDFITDKDWHDLITHRKSVKATQTARAYNTVIKELNEARKMGYTPAACIDEMSNRGWRGFKAEWMENSSKDAQTIDRPSRIRLPNE